MSVPKTDKKARTLILLSEIRMRLTCMDMQHSKIISAVRETAKAKREISERIDELGKILESEKMFEE